jgi:hypothetical protein
VRKTLVCASSAALALAGIPALVAPASAAVTPHLSEIHYDNGGTDVGEAIEVAADPGADLTGWSVVLYNGSGGASYATLPLGTANAAGFAVVNGPATGIQNGSPDAFALVNGTTVVEFLSYEGQFAATSGPAAGTTSTDIGVAEAGTEPAGQSLQRIGDTWTGPLAATFGAPNEEEEPPPPAGVCGDPATLVSDIQGSGATFDPAFGGSQVVEGVVSAVKPGLGGFYVQEEADDVDADPTTSEGIFVFLGSTGTAPEAGRTVRVSGTVAEFGSNGSATQLTTPQITVCDVPAVEVAPTAVTFPLAAASDMERYEGMLVTFEQDLVISEYFEYVRFGEVVAAVPPNGWDRLYTPTAVVEPGAEAIALAELYSRSRITIDDSSTRQNPAELVHPGNGQPFSLTNTFRGGDTITGITGVIDHSFGKYRVHPTQYGEYTVENPRPAAPAVGGEVQVASFNVLNYFLNLTGAGNVCGPDQDEECRGADTEEERLRQRAKIVAAIAALDADVVGLMEMENTTGTEPAADLVAGLNDLLGAGTYAYVDTGVVGTDVIRLGLLYKPAAVTPVGAFDVLDSTDDARFVDTANRPMISQTFDAVADGARFTVSVNHLKSKGSACTGDPDTGDGQGNCNLTRTAAAEAIVDHLATDPTGSGDPDFLVIGDLNSYDREDPIDALVAGGFVDEIKRFGGEYAYGYVFDGQAGYLDHALASTSLDPQVTGAAEWHLNADEPSVLDYDTSFKPDAVDAIYAPDPYRSSDHDAVLVGLDLTAPEPPQATCFGLEPTLVGGDGADVLRGSARQDVIVGGGGDDTIVGLGGDDVICGGDGADIVRAGNGDDRVSAGAGDDVVDGDSGADLILGGDGNDVLRGSVGDDTIQGEDGDDRLLGQGGQDVLDGGAGRNVVRQ